MVYFESTEFTKRLGELGGAAGGPCPTDAIMTAAAMVRLEVRLEKAGEDESCYCMMMP